MTTRSGHPYTPPPASGPPEPCTMRARCPEDLLAMAPVLMGYWPAEAVVMLTFGAEHPFHAGVPLPPRADQSAAVRRELVDLLMEPVRRYQVRQVVLLYHSADPATVAPIHEELRWALHRQGVRLIEAIRADGRQWVDLADPSAPPVDYDVSSHPFVVQAIVGGRLTHGSREDLVRSFDADEIEVARTTAALAAADLDEPPAPIPAVLRAEGEWVHECIAAAAGSGALLSTEDLARTVWAMQAVRVRDAAWGQIDRATATDHVRLWSDAVRRTPEELVAAPAALLGWSAWQAGDGATARIAVDRCLDADPGYRLALYLASILDHAVPPDAWRGGFDWAAGLP